jgi:hypothetical protein
MSREFAHSTAELIVQTTEAVYIKGEATEEFVGNFCDLSIPQTKNALQTAVDLGLLSANKSLYQPSSQLASFISTPDQKQKAAALRIVLETYEPFVIFRERLQATGSADTAAQQTKSLLELSAHREEIKDTLISLGTYSQAIIAEGGGRYKLRDEDLTNELLSVASQCDDLASSEQRIRTQIGAHSDQVDRNEVIVPLSGALIRAVKKEAVGSVTEAARAVESFLVRLGERMQVDLEGASGIIQKLERFRNDNKLPKKIIESAKYLGQIRNAADHGVDADPDVGSVWNIQESTGLQYVYVACSFISACLERENKGEFII